MVMRTEDEVKAVFLWRIFKAEGMAGTKVSRLALISER